MAKKEAHTNASDYERRNMDLTVVSRIALALGVTILFTYVVCVWLLRIWSVPQKLDTPVVVKRLPPEPRLQIDEASDMKQMRGEEKERLTHYGWVDRENGVVSIPIEQAMDKVAKQGLPHREEKQ